MTQERLQAPGVEDTSRRYRPQMRYTYKILRTNVVPGTYIQQYYEYYCCC